MNKELEYNITTPLHFDDFQSWFIEKDDGKYTYDWCYNTLKALYEYYYQMSEDLQETIVLTDPTVIRCEWVVYESMEEAFRQYAEHVGNIESLRDFTEVIEVPGSDKVIVANF